MDCFLNKEKEFQYLKSCFLSYRNPKISKKTSKNYKHEQNSKKQKMWYFPINISNIHFNFDPVATATAAAAAAVSKSSITKLLIVADTLPILLRLLLDFLHIPLAANFAK